MSSMMSWLDPTKAWAKTPGSAGQADLDELKQTLADPRSEDVDAGLERPLRIARYPAGT